MAKRTPKQHRLKAVKKTTKKAASSGPAPRVVKPKRPSLLDLFPPLHADYHAAGSRFCEDLSRLLRDEKLRGRWVVYTPDGRWSDVVTDDDLTLHRLGQERGLQPGHYVVARVVPPPPETEAPAEWFAPADW